MQDQTLNQNPLNQLALKAMSKLKLVPVTNQPYALQLLDWYLGNQTMDQDYQRIHLDLQLKLNGLMTSDPQEALRLLTTDKDQTLEVAMNRRAKELKRIQPTPEDLGWNLLDRFRWNLAEHDEQYL